MAAGRRTLEDGYSVNQDGAWVVDGVVQTKPETASEGEYISLEVGYSASKTTSKFLMPRKETWWTRHKVNY